MNRLLLGILLAVGLTLSAPDATAQQSKGKGKGAPNTEMREQQGRAKDVADEAEELAEQERKRTKEAEERVKEERERAREQAENEEGFGHDLDGDQARGAGRGNEKSQEMRARRDERKAIKAEYTENREAGQEGIDRDTDSDEAADEAADEQKAKDKKPWYKFWDD